MRNEKLKRFFKNIAPYVRGVVKTLPFGSVITEAVQNIQYEVGLKKSESELTDEQKKELHLSKPHRWRSIIIQALGLSAIVYAFYSKIITIEQVLQFINQILKSDIQ